MKSRRVLENQRRKKIIVSALVLALALYILIPFRTSPFQADYTVATDFGQDKLIALTFDDGPDDYTAALLDGLEEYDAKATFFLLGKKVVKNKDIVKRMYDEGFLIGNHTYYHSTLFRHSVSDIKEEIRRTDDEIEKITGERTEFYRPPHGHYLGAQLSKIDKKAILWQYDPADWKHQDAEYVYQYIIRHADDGAIILLHDTKATTVEGALRAVKELSTQGYRFVRADELLCRNGDVLQSGVAYRWCKPDKKPFYF